MPYVQNWASQVAQVVKSPPASAGDSGDVGSIPERAIGLQKSDTAE